MFYADQVGLDQVLARLQELTGTVGPQWTPAPLLERLVAEGKRLSEVRATTGVAAK
jgi:3-hydroxyacyl-CoA dehydrogenase